jgi:hypothetical protein
MSPRMYCVRRPRSLPSSATSKRRLEGAARHAVRVQVPGSQPIADRERDSGSGARSGREEGEELWLRAHLDKMVGVLRIQLPKLRRMVLVGTACALGLLRLAGELESSPAAPAAPAGVWQPLVEQPTPPARAPARSWEALLSEQLALQPAPREWAPPPADGVGRELRVGRCVGDALWQFASEVGRELASRAGRVLALVDLALDGDELHVDWVFCDRAGSSVVQHILRRAGTPAHLQRVQWRWPDGRASGWWSPQHGRVSEHSALPAGALSVGSGSADVIAVDAEHRLNSSRPVIVRSFREPRPSTVFESSVDMVIGVFKRPRSQYIDAPSMFVPRLYLDMVAQGRDPLQLLRAGPPEPNINEGLSAPPRGFAGLLAGECLDLQRPSSVWRVFFFNALAERFQGRREVLELGYCRPRMNRAKPLPESRESDLPDRFDAAIKAFRRVRFGIAFEYSEAPGFITDRIANVKLAGAVPIYWGAPDAAAYLNTDAFIHCNFSTGGDEVIERLLGAAERRLVDSGAPEAPGNSTTAAAAAAAAAAAVGAARRGPAYSKTALLDVVETDALRQLGGDPFRQCLDAIERLEADPEAYRRMRDAPLLRVGSELVNASTYAESLEVAARLARLAVARREQLLQLRLQVPRPRSDPALRIGLCNRDMFSRFAVDVGRELARRAGLEMETVDLSIDGDERFVDVMFCERGSTDAVRQTLARTETRARLDRVQWRWPDGRSSGWWSPHSQDGGAAPLPGALHVGSDRITTLVAGSGARSPSSLQNELGRPIVVRYHGEPWFTGVAPGVDVAVDTKTEKLQGDVVAMYAPYLYISFALRGPGMGEPASLMAGGQLPEGGSPVSQRLFAAFLASYCITQVDSALFRVAFFNALEERFRGRERTLAIGRCTPRTVRTAPNVLRLRQDDPDRFDSAVRAFQGFRFGIAFENSQVPGYITEKIANVKLAGAVPIYWGAPDVASYLNTDAFLWCNVSTAHIKWDKLMSNARTAYRATGAVLDEGHDPPAFLDLAEVELIQRLGGNPFQACLDAVERLNADPVEYRRMRDAPLLKAGSGLFDPAVYAASIEAAIELSRNATRSSAIADAVD